MTLSPPVSTPCERTGVPWIGGGAIAICGALWAGLSALLAAGGHVPSAPFVLLPREEYYIYQALFIGPLLLGLWVLASAVAHRVVAARGSLSSSLDAVGLAYGAVVGGGLLLPEMWIYLRSGFEPLGRAAPLLGGGVALLAWIAVAAALHRAHDVSWRRASWAALAGLLAQAVAGSPFIR